MEGLEELERQKSWKAGRAGKLEELERQKQGEKAPLPYVVHFHLCFHLGRVLRKPSLKASSL